MRIDTLGVKRIAQGQLATSDLESEPECAICGTSVSNGFVYAVGRIEPRFPTLSIEKEFTQAAARFDTQGLTERQLHQTILSNPENRYLIRQVCWVFSVQGLDTYLLRVGDGSDHDLLTGSLRERSNPGDIDVVVGRRGGLTSPSMCNGLIVPLVYADHIYSFDRDMLIDNLPLPENMAGEQFEASAREVLDHLVLLTDNVGASDEHRALNYLALRYPVIYHRVAGSHSQGASLSDVTVQPSGLSQTRRIMDVILSFTDRKTDVIDKYIVRVDVTEQFPFLVTKLSPYFSI